jgi:hypothetical protein
MEASGKMSNILRQVPRRLALNTVLILFHWITEVVARGKAKEPW